MENESRHSIIFHHWPLSFFFFLNRAGFNDNCRLSNILNVHGQISICDIISKYWLANTPESQLEYIPRQTTYIYKRLNVQKIAT